MSSGGGQRRLSDLLSAVPRSSVGSSLDTTLAADEELLVRFWTAAAAPSRNGLKQDVRHLLLMQPADRLATARNRVSTARVPPPLRCRAWWRASLSSRKSCTRIQPAKPAVQLRMAACWTALAAC